MTFLNFLHVKQKDMFHKIRYQLKSNTFTLSKKIFSFLLIFSFLFNIFFSNQIVIATDLSDDTTIEESEMDLVDIQNSIAEVSASVSSTFPTINSKAYVILDRLTNTVIFGENELEQKQMASTTKIMTCIVILENCNLDEVVTVSSKAASTGGSVLGIHTGDTITVKNLLYGLMLKSRK